VLISLSSKFFLAARFRRFFDCNRLPQFRLRLFAFSSFQTLVRRPALCDEANQRAGKSHKRVPKKFQKAAPRSGLKMHEAKQLFFGPFRLDPTNECLWRGKKEIRLHPKAFGLLRYLADHPGQLATKASLLETIWPGVYVTEAILSVYIAEIRKALGEDPNKPRFIETLHRRGYRFIAPVAIDCITGTSQSTPGSEDLRSPVLGEAATAIGLEPLIGREKDICFLREKLTAALRATGSVVFITGAAGIGKSRLVRELGHHAARAGCQWCAGKYEKTANYPYAAWVDMLKGYLQQKDAAPLHRLLGPYAAQLPSIVPQARLRGNHPSSITPKGAETDRARLFEAWTHLFVQMSKKAPLVLFVDDVQWASSLDLLHHLARSIGNQRVLLLVAYRDDELKINATLRKTVLDMNRERLFHPLPLEPLDREDVAQLIEQKVDKPVAPSLVNVVCQRTGGIPFFVEEFLRLLQQRKFLVDTEAGVDLRESASVPVPETVKIAINERVESLGKNAAELLRMASVVGREFPLSVLAEFLGTREEELIGAMDRCEAHGLIHLSTDLGEEKYAFAHDLLQEALYENIGPARRRRHHLRIAQAIEKLYASRLENRCEALAYHFREGNDLEKTAIYSHQAGVKAATHCAYEEAVRYFEQALDAVEHLPENRHGLEQALAIRVDLGPALIAIGSYLAPVVEANYIQAEKLCGRLGETTQLFPILWTLSRIRNWRGELAAARQLGDQLLSLARREQDSLRLLEARHTLWAISLDIGDLASTKDNADQRFMLYDRVRHGQLGAVYGGHDPGVCSQIHAAKAEWLLGYPDRALRTIEAAGTMATELSHPYTLWLARLAAIWIHYHRGERRAAQDQVENLRVLATERENRRWIMTANFLHGWLMVEKGQWERGIGQMRQDEGELIIEARQQSYYSTLLAQAYLAAGQIDQAEIVLNKELTRVRDTGVRYYEAELHRIKGELLLRRSALSRKKAETCFQAAIDLSHDQGAKSLELRATMSLSDLLQKQGKKEEAQQMLQNIYDRFTEGFDTADLKQANQSLDGFSKS
jgi:DNA-binding winged helix-turn-helix (wHTH) protein/predicted ATPase